MERTCSKCKVEKPVSEFHEKKSEHRLNSWCKACVYEKQRRRWVDRKIKAVALMGERCQNCGYDRNYASLDFHHLDPSEKEYTWNELRERPWADVVAELNKCVLLCRNCHGETHYPQYSRESVIDSDHDNRALNSLIEPTGRCPQCDKEVFGTKFCSTECASLAHRKVARPRKKTLEKLLKDMSYCAIGRKYGVTDNAVRKWAKGYDL
jgi:hypothetical protein